MVLLMSRPTLRSNSRKAQFRRRVPAAVLKVARSKQVALELPPEIVGDDPVLLTVTLSETLRFSLRTEDKALRELRHAAVVAFAQALNDAAQKLKRNAEGDYSPDPAAGRFPKWEGIKASTTPPSSRLSFDDLLLRWKRENQKSPSSIVSFNQHVADFKAHLCHNDVRRVTKSDVVAWKDKLLGRGLAAKTINGSYLATISALYNLGKRDDLVENNPTEDVRVAPYHRAKNSVGDAILVETYAEALKSKSGNGVRFAFVTRNKQDFSDDKGDDRHPHPHLAPLFNGASSTYYTSLRDFVQVLNPDLLSDQEEEFNFAAEPRRLAEIVEAVDRLEKQIWYDRHSRRVDMIAKGKIKILPESEYSRNPYRSDEILDTIWLGALDAALDVEDEIGKNNLGPWSDFDWGLLNGKLSALRWLLGEDWDMLDT